MIFIPGKYNTVTAEIEIKFICGYTRCIFSIQRKVMHVLFVGTVYIILKVQCFSEMI